MATQFEKALDRMKVGDTLRHPTVAGLRFRKRRTGIFAEYRFKWHGAWKSVGMGKLGTVYIHNGRPVTLPGEMSLGQMHDRAVELAGKIAAGVDPGYETDWMSFTVTQALELHLSADRLSEKTEAIYRWGVDKHLADWKNRPLVSLGREEVRKRHRSITASAGPYAANSVMRTLSTIYNRAKRQYPELPASPTGNIDWNEEHRRDAAIPLKQLPTWYTEVMALENGIRRDFFLLTALTGLRRHTADKIHTDDIDLDEATLHIPLPKGGPRRVFDIPLSDWLIAIIQGRIAENELWWARSNAARKHKKQPPVQPNGFLFPAHGKRGHLVDPKVAKDFTVGFTVHGLRNTFISAAAAAGVSPYHAKLLANHKVPKGDVHGGYVSSDVEALRPSQQRITDYLRAAMKAT